MLASSHLDRPSWVNDGADRRAGEMLASSHLDRPPTVETIRSPDRGNRNPDRRNPDRRNERMKR